MEQFGDNPEDKWQLRPKSPLTNAEDLRSNWKPGHEIMFQIRETTVLQKVSLRLWELDLPAPICPSRRCSEMDDNQSSTMATCTKLCGNLPYLIYFRWQSTRLAIECRDADIRTGGLAVPSTIPTTIQETKSSGVRQITMPNTMPYLFRSYITENTPEWDPDSDSAIPSYTTTMTIDKCKLTTTNRLPNQALSIDVPYEAIWD